MVGCSPVSSLLILHWLGKQARTKVWQYFSYMRTVHKKFGPFCLLTKQKWWSVLLADDNFANAPGCLRHCHPPFSIDCRHHDTRRYTRWRCRGPQILSGPQHDKTGRSDGLLCVMVKMHAHIRSEYNNTLRKYAAGQ